LALVVLCTAGTLWLARAAQRVRLGADVPFTAKLTSVGLIVFWLAIAMLGRLIAYDKAIWGSLSHRL
jgi:hypothetical protein